MNVYYCIDYNYSAVELFRILGYYATKGALKPTFRSHIQGSSCQDTLTLEYETDRKSRNVCFKLPYAAQLSKEDRITLEERTDTQSRNVGFKPFKPCSCPRKAAGDREVVPKRRFQLPPLRRGESLRSRIVQLLKYTFQRQEFCCIYPIGFYCKGGTYLLKM